MVHGVSEVNLAFLMLEGQSLLPAVCPWKPYSLVFVLMLRGLRAFLWTVRVRTQARREAHLGFNFRTSVDYRTATDSFSLSGALFSWYNETMGINNL